MKPANVKEWFLVDCGEATQHRILSTKLSLSHLSTILITHLHGDHCYGVPGLLASAALAQDRNDPVTIAAPADLKDFIDCTQSVSKLKISPPINFINIEDSKNLQLGEYDVLVLDCSHVIPSYAFLFTEKEIKRSLNTEKLEAEGIPQGVVWGKLQRGEDVTLSGKEQLKSDDFLLPSRKPLKIIAAGDNNTPEILEPYTEGVDLLIHEATYLQKHFDKTGNDHGHSTAKSVAQFAEKAGVKNLILTHFSPRYRYLGGKGESIAEVEEEARTYYSGNLFLANDYDEFILDKNAKLTKKKKKSAEESKANSEQN